MQAELLVDPERWDHMNGMGAGWMWWWGLVVMLVLLVVVVVAAALVARSLGSQPSTARGGDESAPNQRAKALLAERYARGEIDTAEYRERLSELG
ncbi:hypothetical protein [Nocardioides sp.]|uniref:hypothetical protein n=1 Tax=Nocardioides sp. TaxID=35761 RepID=UPI0035629D32